MPRQRHRAKVKQRRLEAAAAASEDPHPLADPTRSFTKALDLEMEGTPPQLGYVRSKRFAAVFDDGKCTNLFVSAAPGDPAGDDDPSASLVENVLKSL